MHIQLDNKSQISSVCFLFIAFQYRIAINASVKGTRKITRGKLVLFRNTSLYYQLQDVEKVSSVYKFSGVPHIDRFSIHFPSLHHSTIEKVNVLEVTSSQQTLDADPM